MNPTCLATYLSHLHLILFLALRCFAIFDFDLIRRMERSIISIPFLDTPGTSSAMNRNTYICWLFFFKSPSFYNIIMLSELRVASFWWNWNWVCFTLYVMLYVIYWCYVVCCMLYVTLKCVADRSSLSLSLSLSIEIVVFLTFVGNGGSVWEVRLVVCLMYFM